MGSFSGPTLLLTDPLPNKAPVLNPMSQGLLLGKCNKKTSGLLVSWHKNVHLLWPLLLQKLKECFVSLKKNFENVYLSKNHKAHSGCNQDILWLSHFTLFIYFETLAHRIQLARYTFIHLCMVSQFCFFLLFFLFFYSQLFLIEFSPSSFLPTLIPFPLIGPPCVAWDSLRRRAGLNSALE